MKKILKNICNSLGENNDAVYAVLAIAVFKGIFRPLFTMMDKKQNPQARKYAAVREGLTEVIAFGSYLGIATLVKTLCKPLAKHAPENINKMKGSLSFLGVCFSAFLVIPAICNATIKPVMKAIDKPKLLPQRPLVINHHLNAPVFQSMRSSRMKVGGL